MFLNKVAWVTGASSGIGFEIVKQLDLAGAKVIISSRNYDQLESIRLKLKNPEKHFVLALDLEKSNEFEYLATQVINKYGIIDFLFNNGGLSQRSNARDTPLEVDRRIMEIN